MAVTLICYGSKVYVLIIEGKRSILATQTTFSIVIVKVHTVGQILQRRFKGAYLHFYEQIQANRNK